MNNDMPKKFNPATGYSASARMAKLKELLAQEFPEVVNEAGVDFDQLRSAVGEDAGSYHGDRIFFGLKWAAKGDGENDFSTPGAEAAKKTAQTMTDATLAPCPEESVNFDDTDNLFIEGDNMEVLKLLLNGYSNKVKMIYIDPPYNTGNDFIYPDNYTENLDSYLRYTGQKGENGEKFSTNKDTDGRFHSNWLNMMYPRLYLARQLLRDDGVIFISIDDNEQHHLRCICDEIFGRGNFVAQFVWEGGLKNDSHFISVGHDYIIVYAKDIAKLKSLGVKWRVRKDGLEDIYKFVNGLPQGISAEESTKMLRNWFRSIGKSHPAWASRHYNNIDSRGVYCADNISWPGGGGPKYEICHPLTQNPVTIPSRGWLFNKDEMQKKIIDGRVVFGEDETKVPTIKRYLKETESRVLASVIYADRRSATKDMRKLFNQDLFDNPKDVGVITTIIECSTTSDDIILDFFAGSCTTAHAVMKLNAEDGGNRKFIMVQLPEPCDKKSEAYKANYKTIADIGRERIRRAAKKIAEENPDKQLDLGFKAFKLAETNLMAWQGDTRLMDGDIKHNLFTQMDAGKDGAVKEGALPLDIVYEYLLKTEKLPLTQKISKETIAGEEIFVIRASDDTLRYSRMICLAQKITMELIEAMVKQLPAKIVCLESAFDGSDELKLNASYMIRQIAKQEGMGHAIEFEVL